MKRPGMHGPRFRHLYLLLGWPVFFIFFYLTETLIPSERCHLIHNALDARIPFREEFAIFYVGWYLLLAFSLAYFLLCSIRSFRKLQTYIIIVQALAVVIYILYPTRQDLRPVVFPRENFLSAVMALIYRIDTPTGVCPSLHVAISIGIASVWLHEERAGPWAKALITVFCLGVCLSVAFVKQHSVVDIIAAVPISLIGWWVAIQNSPW